MDELSIEHREFARGVQARVQVGFRWCLSGCIRTPRLSFDYWLSFGYRSVTTRGLMYWSGVAVVGCPRRFLRRRVLLRQLRRRGHNRRRCRIGCEGARDGAVGRSKRGWSRTDRKWIEERKMREGRSEKVGGDVRVFFVVP